MLGWSRPWPTQPLRGVQGSPTPFVYSYRHSWPVGRPTPPGRPAAYNPLVIARQAG
ncbi:MAG: hypothetical protein M3Z04_17135 [Chloroflexota bacterium]|nr:hypothetical protein [Chloroflexota bacterium]